MTHRLSPAQQEVVDAMRDGKTITFTPADEPAYCDECHDEIPVGGTGLLVPTGREWEGKPVIVVACSSKCREALLAKEGTP